MSENEIQQDLLLAAILDLLASAGYSRAGGAAASSLDDVLNGLAWCVTAADPSTTVVNNAVIGDKIMLGEFIEAALKSMNCPYPIQARQILLPDCMAVYPAAQWIANQVLKVRVSIEEEIKEEEMNIVELSKLLIEEENEVKLLHTSLKKKEAAAKRRENLLLKRQCDDLPSQSELIQYKLRFSEINDEIEEKLRETHKCFATYNALLEIKDLMLKEISLLNSMCSQFQDAMASTNGRAKLIDSMEKIVAGSQQKLNKVRIKLHSEQELRDSMKDQFTAKVAEQRHQATS